MSIGTKTTLTVALVIVYVAVMGALEELYGRGLHRLIFQVVAFAALGWIWMPPLTGFTSWQQFKWSFRIAGVSALLVTGATALLLVGASLILVGPNLLAETRTLKCGGADGTMPLVVESRWLGSQTMSLVRPAPFGSVSFAVVEASPTHYKAVSRIHPSDTLDLDRTTGELRWTAWGSEEETRCAAAGQAYQSQ